MQEKSKKLFLLTSTFPFGTGETFLETEIKYLCQSFEQVEIIAVNPKGKESRVVPSNCVVNVMRIDRGYIQKLRSLLGIFDPKVKNELNAIRNIYHLRLNKKIFSTLLFSLHYSKKIVHQLELLKIESDQVFYSYWCDDRALALAILSDRRKGIKAICRIHRWDVYFEESKAKYLPFRHYITQKLDRIFSISQDGIDYAVNHWRVDRSKFVLSRLGIDNEYGPVKSKNDGIFRIVSCSNIIPVKRVDLIAEALKVIKNFKIEWTHIGDGPLKKELEEKIKLLPSNVSVNLVGRIPNKDVYKIYESICPDLFINVSSSEGVPVSIMEAMSYGIPVIATNVGGNSEIVNETNGILISINFNCIELAEGIESIIRKAPNLELNKNAFKVWKNVYCAETNYSEFSELIKSL